MRKPRLVVPLSLLLTMPVLLLAETHRLVPEMFYNTFSGAYPPVLRIKPGDRVVTKTIDASGTDWNGKLSRAVRIHRLAPSTSSAGGAR